MMGNVSIIISSYNCAAYLAAAIESALAQTLPCEVIVVDNGSEDNSQEILAEYVSKVTVIRQENLGEAGAVHTGLVNVTGDIIIILDADDLLYAECAETVVRNFRPGMSKLQYCLHTVDGNGDDRKISFPHYPDELNANIVRQINIEQGGYLFPVTCGNAYNRNFLTQILPVPDARFTFNADGYINRLATLYGDVESLSCILGAYRVHSRNLWARNDRSDMWVKQLCDELDRQEIFERHAACFGVNVPADALLRNVRHLEVRILSLRFTPNMHPAIDDRRLLLLHNSLFAPWRTFGLTPLGRLAWAAYLIFIILSPLQVLRWALPTWRGSSVRSTFARAILSVTRLDLLPRTLHACRRQVVVREPNSKPNRLASDRDALSRSD